jgi:hypothetical protein
MATTVARALVSEPSVGTVRPAHRAQSVRPVMMKIVHPASLLIPTW